MKILVLTSLFPNPKQPLHGIFVKKRVLQMAKFAEVKVVAPVPWAPFAGYFSRRYEFLGDIPAREEQDGLEVLHPRFLATPKVGRSLHGLMYFCSLYRFIKALQREYNFDMLDVHFAYPDGFAGAMIAKLLNKPVSVTVRGTDVNLYPKYLLHRKQIAYSLGESNLVIGVCKALTDEASTLGVSAEKLRVIQNGVSPSEFYPADKIQSRAELGLPRDKKIILSVGHLVERKGFHHILDAARIMVSDFGMNDTFVVIVGEGEYRRELESQIGRQGLASRVKLAGAIPNLDLYKWYSAADVFCLASSREGWPNVILEAFACGSPVVATKIWGTPEAVCSPEYGILVEKREGGALAGALSAALNTQWDRDKIIAYARANTWEEVGRRVVNEFALTLSGQFHHKAGNG
ncbi:MAG: glycosyltransferase [Deltaproteobacteria bacterium]